MAPLTTGVIQAILREFSQQRAGRGRYGSGSAPAGITATGGVISDYTSGPAVYRAHIFTSSGTFSVSALATDPALPNSIEYLVVAGGGGGGQVVSGGGGAGGFRTGSAFPVSTSPGDYTITVGGGGAGSNPGNKQGSDGNLSVFAPGYVGVVTSTGGGGGADEASASPGINGRNGGSGGGSLRGNGGLGNTPATSPSQGNDGGSGSASGQHGAGGGGGAGASGVTGTDGVGGAGGSGAQSTFLGSPYYFAGGGGGSAGIGGAATAGAGGLGGGGGAGAQSPATPGAGGGSALNSGVTGTSTGGGSGGTSTGGGGGGAPHTNGSGGSGGSGIVVVRYQIASLTATAKATGGAISFYSGKTIHTFLGSGTFATAPNWTSSPVEYVVVAGGGGGATNYGGGGGAGGYRTGTTPIGAHPVSTTIQVGAGGLQTSTPTVTNGTPSYFGTPITSAGGGGGAPDSIGGPGTGLDAGNAGGSGGGGGLDGPITVAAGNTPLVSPPQGNPGGIGKRAGGPIGAGGGGGGKGGAGADADSGGLGGPGFQIPSTFLNPISIFGTPGPNPGSGYVAGGGSSANPAYPVQSTPNPGGGGYQTSYPSGPSTSGLENTGGGGGGNFQSPTAGNGGSGIVIIAYPS